MTATPQRGSRSKAKADAVAYHNEIASRWSAGYGGGGFQARMSELKGILARNVRTGDSWADLGCGSGVLTKELLDLGAGRVVGVDGSREMLACAGRDVRVPAGVEVTWIESRVESLPSMDSESIDGVLCSSVIEYVDNPDDVLREIARVLKRGGRLVLSVPPRGSLVRSLQKAVRWVSHAFGHEVFTYLSVSRFEVERNALARLFEHHGLAVSRVTGFDPVLPRALSALLQPSLLIVEGRKLPA